MFKRYTHLVTFQEAGNSQLMRSTTTKSRNFTVDEWNSFTKELFGANKAWSVINVVTLTY